VSGCFAPTVNFGSGHLYCYNCPVDMVANWQETDCKAFVAASAVASQAAFQGALMSSTAVTVSASFTTSSEIVILNVAGLTVNGGGFTINGGGAHRIFYVANPGTTVTINNLILTSGYSASTAFGGAWGGAMYVGTGVNVVLSSCTFSNSVAANGYGGGLALGGMTGISDIVVVFITCTFTGNSVVGGSGYGGGLFIGVGVTVTIEDSAFSSNIGAAYGGGIAQWTGSTATLDRVVFTSNSAVSGAAQGGGYYMKGGVTCVVWLTDCTFTTNTVGSGGNGGGVSTYIIALCKFLKTTCHLVRLCLFFLSDFLASFRAGLHFSRRSGCVSQLRVRCQHRVLERRP
jgi:hypothetical protein